MFRDEQTTTTEKLTEMIKIEIDTRLTSDMQTNIYSVSNSIVN